MLAVGFAYWDARTTVTEEVPDIAEKVVAFAYTDMIPNGGVAVDLDASFYVGDAAGRRCPGPALARR